jgi:hypothetical protein
MWTDVAPVLSATTFTLKDLVSYRAFDTNRTSAVAVSWITLVLDLIIAIPALWYFYYSYEIAYNIRHDKWEHVYNDAGFDENGYTTPKVSTLLAAMKRVTTSTEMPVPLTSPRQTME